MSRESLVLFELRVLWSRESLVLFELRVLMSRLSLLESRVVVLPESRFVVFVVVFVVLLVRVLLRVVLLSLFDEFMLLLLRSLLSEFDVLFVFECVLLLLLSDVLFDEFMLLLLRSLLSVLVLLVLVVAVRVVLTVLPPRATTESSACALSEKASEIAVTSKVLFIRFPLWV
jgi:hypothetical protein